MAARSTVDLDLLALAEDTTADRRALSNVIDQIAVAEPDDETRRQAVAEFQSLVVALTAVRRHAAATAKARLGAGGPPVTSDTLALQSAGARGRAGPSQRRRPGRPYLVVGTGLVLLAIAVLAAIATSLR